MLGRPRTRARWRGREPVSSRPTTSRPIREAPTTPSSTTRAEVTEARHRQDHHRAHRAVRPRDGRGRSWKAPSWPSSIRSARRRARPSGSSWVSSTRRAPTAAICARSSRRSSTRAASSARRPRTPTRRAAASRTSRSSWASSTVHRNPRGRDALYELPRPAQRARSPPSSSARRPRGSFYAFAGANELAAPAEARARPARRLAGRLHRVGAPAHRPRHGGRGRPRRHMMTCTRRRPRVRLRVRGRHGGDAVPHEQQRGRCGRHRGAQAGVRGHHARPQELFLTCAYARQIFGQTSSNPISRFIQEILEAAPDHRPRLGRLQRHGLGGGSAASIAGSGTEAGGGRVFGRSSASGPVRPQRRARRAREQLLRASRRREESAAKMTFAAGDTVDHKTFGRGR